MIVVNFKTYLQGTGERAVELARIAARVAKDTGVRIVVAPELGDMEACKETGAECWAQHVDPVEPDRHTGFVTIEEVTGAGATGTLLNHSEHRMSAEEVGKVIERAKQFSGFKVCVCAADLPECTQMAKLFPNFISYEPPELVGSREKSVASEKPEVVEAAVKAVPIPVLIGAGIHSQEDVKVGLKLHAVGVLVATDVVLAVEPEKELRKLADAFKM